MNANASLSEADIKEFSLIGGDVLRFSFALQPLMSLDPPYSFDEHAFQLLDDILEYCEKHGVKAIINPHRFPGTEHKWTMLGSDPFWKDFQWHDRAILLWEEVAKRYSDRGDVIAGYDLLNEPAVGFVGKKGYSSLENSPADINLLYKKIVAAVRRHDKVHKLIVASPRYADARGKHENLKGFDILLPVADDNVEYTIHIYDPMGFTHQGFGNNPLDISYPGVIDGEMWNRDTLEKRLLPTVEFQREHEVGIFVGEFGAPRWTGESGVRYLTDIVFLAEKYGWSWAYHAYRQAPIWDAEMSYDRNDMHRRADTPKMKLFGHYFNKNKQN